MKISECFAFGILVELMHLWKCVTKHNRIARFHFLRWELLCILISCVFGTRQLSQSKDKFRMQVNWIALRKCTWKCLFIAHIVRLIWAIYTRECVENNAFAIWMTLWQRLGLHVVKSFNKRKYAYNLTSMKKQLPIFRAAADLVKCTRCTHGRIPQWLNYAHTRIFRWWFFFYSRGNVFN